MDTALATHRLHFAFTITYHYLFPQLTMGLALLIFILKTLALRTQNPVYDTAARFWGKIFGINFLMGVVTGIPMEFQFGTNWSEFSRLSGGVIGQTLALEGTFAFFLESSFLGLFLYGGQRLSPRLHWLSSLAVFVGSWLSGYFIVATNAWMQHPVGYELLPDGRMQLQSLRALLSNPWLMWQYPHVMVGSVVTATTVMAAVGSFYLLQGKHTRAARSFLRLAVPVGLLASLLSAFPTGDQQGKMLAQHQPVTLAAVEGLFRSEEGAPLVLIGQPDVEAMHLDNALEVPAALSFLTYNRWNAHVTGLDAFPEADWPQNIPLLYYCFHIMVGLGTLMILVFGISAILLWRRRLHATRPVLWVLLFTFPFAYIANTAGWLSAELGRQPWVIYGILRTADAASPTVSAGNAMFSLLGFMGLYALLSVLFLLLIRHEIEHGPASIEGAA